VAVRGKFVIVGVVVGGIIQHVRRLAGDGGVGRVNFVGVGRAFEGVAGGQSSIGFSIVVSADRIGHSVMSTFAGIAISLHRYVFNVSVAHAVSINQGVMCAVASAAVGFRRSIVRRLVTQALGVRVGHRVMRAFAGIAIGLHGGVFNVSVARTLSMSHCVTRTLTGVIVGCRRCVV
jgi:hypothetical protein